MTCKKKDYFIGMCCSALETEIKNWGVGAEIVQVVF